MEKIYIIKGKSDLIVEDDLCVDISLTTENLLEDWQYHDWIVVQFKKFNPKKLIIPLDFDENFFAGLILGLHIRLNHELSHEQRCVPIVFISDRHSFESIFSDSTLSIKQNRALPHYLLTTPNVYLEKPDLEIIKSVFEVSKSMSYADYKNRFLDVIKILPSETIGKHSLANVWGAFRLAQTTEHSKILEQNTELLRKQRDLYFKYISAYSLKENLSENDTANSGLTINSEDKNIDEANNDKTDLGLTINSEGKNILLIDDEANKGWDVVLKAIFKGANFEVSGKDSDEKFELFLSKSIDKALELNQDNLPKWDLILLDLRLDEEEDLGDKADKLAGEYSGAKLLEKIKTENKGTQVIMLTASNKAWNMKKLLDLGADGYYIKESPEFNFSSEFTNESYQNLVKEIESCFDKKFAQKIFRLNDSIIKRLEKENSVFGYGSLKRKAVFLCKAHLNQAFNAIYNYSTVSKEYALYSFLEYYKIVELLGKEMISENRDNSKLIIKRRIGDIDFIIKSPLQSKIRPIKSNGSVETYELSNYFPDNDDEKYYTGRISSSLQFSGLLLLRFGFNEDDVKDFMTLNKLRNDVVAHSAVNSNAEITVQNVIELAEMLEKVFKKL